MAVMAQYKTENGAVKCNWIDSDIEEEPTGLIDAIIYKIHTIFSSNGNFYICFGNGSYGSGNHHKRILILTIENDQLVECIDCIDEKYKLIEAPRSIPISLSYSGEDQMLSFEQFPFDEDIGYFNNKGERIQLHFKDGKFQ